MERPRIAFFVGYTLVAVGALTAGFALVGAALGAFDWPIVFVIALVLLGAGIAAVSAGTRSQPYGESDR